MGLSVSALRHNLYMCLAVFIVGTVVVFFSLFEGRDVSAEKIVLIAVLAGLSSAGRVVFSGVPSVQPSSFIIIMTGVVFGPQMGFMTGAVTALASNLILGQGPWTPWQMFAWGIMGALSGLLPKWLGKNGIFMTVYSFLWGFLFGWIMNLWYSFGGFGTFISASIASFPMDLAHAISNGILMLFFGGLFTKKFLRIAVKYGLTGHKKV